jgi:type I restriction enzyme M protein
MMPPSAPLRQIGQDYPACGFGGMFYQWIFTDNPKPYNSFGNGAGMRVSPAGFAANNLKQAVSLSRAVTAVTHNHPEGIKGAEAVAVAIFLARTGHTKDEIKRKISESYYPLDFTADEIRPTYEFNETCQGTVPQAIVCFLESESFEDAIRTAVSIGGDSDTLAAITGGIAEAYYGIPEDFQDTAMTYLNEELLTLVIEWQAFMSENPATAKN